MLKYLVLSTFEDKIIKDCKAASVSMSPFEAKKESSFSCVEIAPSYNGFMQLYHNLFGK